MTVLEPFYSDPLVTLYLGDCLDVMRELPDASVDAVVTDPPYGLGFMGKAWDSAGALASRPPSAERAAAEGRDAYPRTGKGPAAVAFDAHGFQSWCTEWATEAFRVLKPGGYLLAFGGTRTVHRLASAIEDAGFEIRDELVWIYASGFPKSLDVGKAIDKAAGADREVTGPNKYASRAAKDPGIFQQAVKIDQTAPATDLAKQWDGWGTALKPAHEPIVMARKPLVGTVAANVAKWGTGAINVDGTRIPGAVPSVPQPAFNTTGTIYGMKTGEGRNGEMSEASGRWPSNILLSDPELFDQPNPYVVGSGATSTDNGLARRDLIQPRATGGDRVALAAGDHTAFHYGDSGGYSRFFIIPKADRAERERGLAGAPTANWTDGREKPIDNPRLRMNAQRANVHPTVKPIDLMRHLVRLVTPPGGTVLDPFLGSGTTALAASEEGFRCIGIEREAEYLEIAKGRLMATPMGLGLDVPASTRPAPKTHPDLSKHQPKRRAPAENWTGGWAGTEEPEEAA